MTEVKVFIKDLEEHKQPYVNGLKHGTEIICKGYDITTRHPIIDRTREWFEGKVNGKVKHFFRDKNWIWEETWHHGIKITEIKRFPIRRDRRTNIKYLKRCDEEELKKQKVHYIETERIYETLSNFKECAFSSITINNEIVRNNAYYHELTFVDGSIYGYLKFSSGLIVYYMNNKRRSEKEYKNMKQKIINELQKYTIDDLSDIIMKYIGYIH